MFLGVYVCCVCTCVCNWDGWCMLHVYLCACCIRMLVLVYTSSSTSSWTFSVRCGARSCGSCPWPRCSSWRAGTVAPSYILLPLYIHRQRMCTFLALFLTRFCNRVFFFWMCVLSVMCVWLRLVDLLGFRSPPVLVAFVSFSFLSFSVIHFLLSTRHFADVTISCADVTISCADVTVAVTIWGSGHTRSLLPKRCSANFPFSRGVTDAISTKPSPVRLVLHSLSLSLSLSLSPSPSPSLSLCFPHLTSVCV